MWIWAVFLCASWGHFNQQQCCFSVWTGQVGEIGLCSSPMTKSIKSALNGIFFSFQNRKDFRNSNVSRVADLKGAFEIHTPKKQRRAWRNATSPSVQHTAHSLMAPYEDPPTSYSLLLFLLFLASSPSQVVRWLLFLGLVTCTNISFAPLSICLLENCLFAPLSQGTAPPGPNTGGLYSERFCYLYQLISFSVAPSVCLPPLSLLALGHCFPWSQ